MGLFDLPAPVFSAIDGMLESLIPPALRLVLWGIFAGWLTMLAYRLFSNQERIGEIKAEQKLKTTAIAEFDGEFMELLPIVRHALALGFRQLGLALGPALLASIPILFIVIWVAGEFAYQAPEPGSEVRVRAEPANSDIQWSSAPETWIPDNANNEIGWLIEWPSEGQPLTLSDGREAILELPLAHDVPIIHKKRWWNLLMANPIGYLPEGGVTDVVHIELPEQTIIGAGPDWVRGWMFSFFMALLLSSVGFKLLFRLD